MSRSVGGGQKTGRIMQFHLNGFEPGDPEISDRSERYPASGAQGSVPDEVDVLIVGCGPAGLTLAAQLSAFPDIKTCIVEQKPGPIAARPGRRHRLPHHGDVPRLRLQRTRAEGGVLDQRDDVLEAGRQAAARISSAAAGCRTSRTACRNFRTSFSIRRACMISISTSCADRRRSSSRIMRGASLPFEHAAGGGDGAASG